MKTPQHRIFLRDNEIVPESIPEPIADAIALYKKGEKRLGKHSKTEGKCLQDLLIRWDVDILAELRQEFPNSAKPRSNEAILQKLYRQGRRTGIFRSELHALGFKSDWKQKKIFTKNHCLERTSVFSFTFSLKKT